KAILVKMESIAVPSSTMSTTTMALNCLMDTCTTKAPGSCICCATNLVMRRSGAPQSLPRTVPRARGDHRGPGAYLRGSNRAQPGTVLPAVGLPGGLSRVRGKLFLGWRTFHGQVEDQADAAS